MADDNMELTAFDACSEDEIWAKMDGMKMLLSIYVDPSDYSVHTILWPLGYINAKAGNIDLIKMVQDMVKRTVVDA